MNSPHHPKRKETAERQLDAELRFHFEQQVADNIAAGMSPEEAHRRANLEFGGMTQMKEECRDARRFAWFTQLGQDLRQGVRQLRRAPGFAFTAIATVALGIGLCTALFSIVNGVLLRPLPFPDPEQMVILSETRPPNRQQVSAAPGAYFDWAEQNTTFSYLAARKGWGYTVKRDGRTVSVGAQCVTANYFKVLGIEPLLGRAFLPEEEVAGKDNVVILSHGAWQNRLGGQKDIVGQTLLLDDRPHVIVGVLPERNLIWGATLFTPLSFTPGDRNDYGSHGLATIGRLKPGVTLAQAQADMDRVSEQIAQAHPASNLGHGAQLTLLLHDLTRDVRVQLWILLGAVGFVLLIACVNVASLLLARANARQKEIAVRAALGASRGRIVRQFLAESLLIAGVGGGLGVLLAYGTLGGIRSFIARYVPRTEEIALHGSVLAWSVGLVLLAGLIVGLIPALQFTRGDLAEPLKDAGRGSSGGRKRQRLRSALVAIEIALALMLLAGTGLLARSLTALQQADQGFSAANVYNDGIFLSGKKYDTAPKGMAFFRDVTERLQALPGVEAVAFSNGLPMMGIPGLLFNEAGAPELPVREMPKTAAQTVSPDYFKAMSIPLRQGRFFTADDRMGAARVVIVNEELVRRHFPNRNPIGQRLMIMTMADKPDVVREIVGVVGDVRPNGPQSAIGSHVYEPHAQLPQSGMQLVVKTRGPVPGLSEAVSRVFREMDPELPVRGLQPYEGRIANSWFRQRFSMILFTVFSGCALVLAALGIYGVMAYAVAQRTQEIGIRMALGAQGRDVVRLILDGGAKIVTLGLLLGVTGALVSARVLATLLYNTSPVDPLTLATVAALLALVAFLACWLPARRATRVNPVVALRNE